MPHPANHAIDEQDRVVPGLARRGERAGGRRARVQTFPGLTCDDIRVEVRQQPDPAVRLGRRPGVTGYGPSRLALHLDALQLPGQLAEQPAAYPGGMPTHRAKCAGVAGPYAYR